MTIRNLSHSIRPGMPVFPGDPAVRVEAHATLEADGVAVSHLHLGTHAGTHIDAPAHTESDGATLDAVPIERFRFEAQLIDCGDPPAGSEIGPEVLPDTTTADLCVFRTGWDAHWGTDRYVDHPILAPEVGAWCTEHDVSVAVDTLNPDPSRTAEIGPGHGPDLPVHRHILGADNLIMENLTNLAGLPERFILMAFPLPIQGADASPVRAVAVLDGEGSVPPTT